MRPLTSPASRNTLADDHSGSRRRKGGVAAVSMTAVSIFRQIQDGLAEDYPETGRVKQVAVSEFSYESGLGPHDRDRTHLLASTTNSDTERRTDRSTPQWPAA